MLKHNVAHPAFVRGDCDIAAFHRQVIDQPMRRASLIRRILRAIA